MAGRQLTSFEHILLGLTCATPSSGYDLKRIFGTTPMGVYQPSSGALYPALRRLEAAGLIRERNPSGSADRSARQRRVYQPTHAGHAAHLRWLRSPVAPATVSRDLGLHLIRFVMMERLLPPADVIAFLQSLASGLAGFIAQMEQYLAGAPDEGRHPLLALDHGLAVHRASLHWAEHAIATLSGAGRAVAESAG